MIGKSIFSETFREWKRKQVVKSIIKNMENKKFTEKQLNEWFENIKRE
jgi:hypothetical protein